MKCSTYHFLYEPSTLFIDSREKLFELTSSKRWSVPPHSLQISCTEESDIDIKKPYENESEAVKLKSIIEKKISIRKQKLLVSLILLP